MIIPKWYILVSFERVAFSHTDRFYMFIFWECKVLPNILSKTENKEYKNIILIFILYLCFDVFTLAGKTQRLFTPRKPCFHKNSTLDRQKNHKLLIHVIMRRSGSRLGQTGFNCVQVSLSSFTKCKTMFLPKAWPKFSIMPLTNKKKWCSIYFYL